MTHSANDRRALDALQPHSRERSAMQVRGLLELLSPPPRQVLELGSGCGRLVLPLARFGHGVTAVERDKVVLDQCANALRETAAETITPAQLVCDDFVRWLAACEERCFDAIICAGNTFMTIAELDAAIAVLADCRRVLKPGGSMFLDDLAHDLWPELTEGNWQSGLAEDSGTPTQLVWHPDDAIFTIRRGELVDPDCWELKEGDDLYRMWTSSALRMAAKLAGLSEPVRLAESGLLLLPRP